MAEALAAVTLAMTEPGIDPADHAFCFRWLVSWAFNRRERLAGLPRDEDAVFGMTWVAHHSLPVAALSDPKIARSAYNSTTTDSFGKPYAVNTYRNKRKGLCGTINFAIEMGRLDSNPLERISTNPPRRNYCIDRRVVVNPGQARSLIEATRDQSPSAPQLVAFFARLYEALALRRPDCVLPEPGWGELCFAESVPYAKGQWTDDGERSPRKSLKHRAPGQSRAVPACPELVAYPRAHIEQFSTAPDGRLFHRATCATQAPRPG